MDGNWLAFTLMVTRSTALTKARNCSPAAVTSNILSSAPGSKNRFPAPGLASVFIGNMACPALFLSVINYIFDIGEKNFGDLAVRTCNFDGWPTERLSAAQVVNSPADAPAIVGDDFDIIAVKHPLQFFHHREKIRHDFVSFLL